MRRAPTFSFGRHGKPGLRARMPAPERADHWNALLRNGWVLFNRAGEPADSARHSSLVALGVSETRRFSGRCGEPAFKASRVEFSTRFQTSRRLSAVFDLLA